MRPTSSRLFLFALVLILGQWLTLAHAVEHPALASGGESTCELCLHAHQLGGALPATSPALVIVSGHESFAPPTPRAAHAVAAAHYPIRGPPLHS